MTDYTLDGDPRIDLTIYGSEDNDLTAMHLRYEGQCNDQPIVMDITPGEEEIDVDIAPDPNIGGVPEEVWNGRVIRISRRDMLTRSEARAFVEQNADVIREICAGHSVEWDGSNMVGRAESEREGDLFRRLDRDFEELESAYSYADLEFALGPDGLDADDLKRLDSGEITIEDAIAEIRSELLSQGIACTADDADLSEAIQEDLERYRERKAEAAAQPSF